MMGGRKEGREEGREGGSKEIRKKEKRHGGANPIPLPPKGPSKCGNFG